MCRPQRIAARGKGIVVSETRLPVPVLLFRIFGIFRISTFHRRGGAAGQGLGPYSRRPSPSTIRSAAAPPAREPRVAISRGIAVSGGGGGGDGPLLVQMWRRYSYAGTIRIDPIGLFHASVPFRLIFCKSDSRVEIRRNWKISTFEKFG